MRGFHFLGGVTFAFLLIALAAFFVVAGTVIESKTGSHRLAAAFTYHHPFFQILLSLFFLNILFAAIRRWPFKLHHIPFLMTHLGLLMIIAGVIVKQRNGMQAHLFLTAGAGTTRGFITDEPVLRLEKRKGRTVIAHEYPVRTGWRGNPYIHPSAPLDEEFKEVKPTLVSFLLNKEETWEGWIKGDHLSIAGLPPLEVYEWNSNAKDSLPLPYVGKLFPQMSQEWNILPFRCQNLAALAEAAYVQHQTEKVERRPTLCVIQNEKEEVHLFFFDLDGEVQQAVFSPHQLSSFVAYEGGFGGYTIQAEYVPPFLREDFRVRKTSPFTIETSLVRHLDSNKKQNKTSLPGSSAIYVHFSDEENSLPPVGLPFDPSGIGLKWPILIHGETYLARFQPRSVQLPYRIKLQDARQIPYPGSAQPFSFEARVVIQDRKRKRDVEAQLSMNHVHSTREGYRFYLTNLTPAEETGVQKVQLTVNYDPAKALLTYPGAIILAMGIFGLFWGGGKKQKGKF